MINLFIILLVVRQCLAAMDPEDMAEFFKHTGADGTQHGRSKDDSDYYTTNSYLPHLPTISGFMGTHGTYRFFTIHEQTGILIGEGKHGVWRVQENGFIREYRKKGKEGLPDGVDPNNLGNHIQQRLEYMQIINDNYAHYIPEESWTGYKYPDDRVSDGKADNMTGYLNFIDLSIYHLKYKMKYDNHVPIDLPHFYCTMTRDDYAHMKNVWKYATAQPLANTMGPLARRAGLDIKENYFNVLRFNFISDSGVWANVGVDDASTDHIVKTLDELKERYQTINYQRVDHSKMDIEVYLFERPFFNVPYIFVTVIMENKASPTDYSYLRPHGAYWDGLVTRNKFPDGNNTIAVQYPKVYVENYPVKGNSSQQLVYGLPLYGQHHPARFQYGLSGGACPNRGGDWGRYPWGNSGAGFPTNYEEITPICDGLVIDMKLWMNLQEKTWNNANLFLGNAGFKGKIVINYTSDANIYGKYTDKYLIDNNFTNPFLMDLTKNGTIVKPKGPKPPRVVFRMNFTRLGTYLGCNNCSVVKSATTQPPSSSTHPSNYSSVNATLPPCRNVENNAAQIPNNLSFFVLAVICISSLFSRGDIL